MNNLERGQVFSTETDELVWGIADIENVLKYNDSFERPFPTTNCKSFKKGKKAY